MKTVFAFSIAVLIAMGSVHAGVPGRDDSGHDQVRPSGTITTPTTVSSGGNHKTLYVHGLKPFKNNTHCQNKTTCYDGWNGQKYTGANVRHAGYFSLVNPTYSVNLPNQKSGVVQVLDIMNRHCRRDQGKSCEMICGSMGCYTISYVLATYNNDRKYNVTAVSALASAGGGSEVANLGTGIATGLATALGGLLGGAISEAILRSSAFGALRTSYARSRWDHNRNNGALFYHKAGNKRLWPLNWVWKGAHDRMVSFHSQCGYRDVRAFEKCGGTTESRRVLRIIKWRPRWVTITTTYSLFTGHRASGRVSSSGISGAAHGYMSKTPSAQTKR